MGAEVHHRVGLETVPDVQIGGDVGVGRSHLDAVDQLVFVAPLAGQRLRHQNHVAEAELPQRQVAFGGAEVLAREVAVALDHGLIQIGGHAFRHPAAVFFGGDGDRGRIFGELLHRPLGVTAEVGGILLDLPIQLGGGLRQRAGPVTRIAQVFEGVEERVADFEAAGVERVLAGALVEDDGDFLLRIGFSLELGGFPDQLGEALEPVGNHPELEQSARIAEKRREHKGRRPAVEFGHGDALAQHPAGHPALVAQILLIRLIDLDRTEQGNVALFQELNPGLGVAHREPAVGLVDHQVGLGFVDHFGEAHHAVGGDHVEAAFLERLDQLPEVAAAVAGEDADGGSTGTQPSGQAVPTDVLPIGLEGVLLLDVEKGALEHFFGRLRLGGAEALAVDFVADEVEHPAEVLLAAIVEIALERGGLGFAQGVERGLLAGRGGGVDRLFEPVDHRLLFGGEVEAHPEKDDHIVLLELVAFFVVPGDGFDPDRRIELLVEQRSEDVFGVIDERHPGRRTVGPVEQETGRREGNQRGGEEVFRQNSA